MIIRCCWCDRGRPKFLAQKTLKHAVSHGLCAFHTRYEHLKFSLAMSRIHQDTSQNPDTQRP